MCCVLGWLVGSVGWFGWVVGSGDGLGGWLGGVLGGSVVRLFGGSVSGVVLGLGCWVDGCLVVS